MPEVKSLHRYASFCANRTKLRLSCVLVLIRASSQATRKKKLPTFQILCANFWADSWGWGIFPQHKAIRVERLQVLQVKFEAADEVYLWQAELHALLAFFRG